MTASQWLRTAAGLCLGLAGGVAPAQTPADFAKILPAIQFLLGDDIDLTIVAPADGSTTTAVSVNVSGTVIGPAGVAVQANGIAGIVTGTGYTVSQVPLTLGVNTIKVTASAPNAVPTVGSVTVNRTAQVYNIFTDHLNTPRLITNSVGQPVWRYDNNDPFGGNVPDENPSGLGTFEFPLRDAGTYFDKETGMVYNWNRYRDLPSDRFIQADPLGLDGGDLSLYVLRSNNPLSFTDPLGLMGRGGMPTRGGYWPPGRGPQYPSNVWVCARPVDINWLPDGSGNYLPQHAWIKTPNVESGMGGDCPVPGQQCSDSPYANTKVVSHAGQSGQAGSVCRMQTNVDQKCVENLLETGRATGRWTVTNQCQSFVSDVINACRR